MARSLFAAVMCIVLTCGVVSAQDDETPPIPPGSDYYVMSFVNNSTPFVGEEVIFTLRYYAYIVPELLRPELPDFRGFWVADECNLISGRRETINNRQYNVFERYAVIVPLREGVVTIEPAALEIPETVFSPGLRLSTDLVILNVQPLPPGAPDGFYGVVGQYDINVALDQTIVTVGQPLRLSLTIEGTGNLEQFSAPHVPLPPGWRLYADAPSYRPCSGVSGLLLRRKEFRWLLVPGQAGTQTLPPLIFVFFDPQSQIYRTLVGPAISVDVLPGGEGSFRPSGTVPDLAGRPAIKPIPSRLRTGTGTAVPLLWFLWMAPPSIALAAGSWLFARRQVERLLRRRRRARALSLALTGLARAQKMPPIEAGLHIVLSASRYLTDLTGKADYATSSWDSWNALLSEYGVERPILDALGLCMAEAEAARFAPGALLQNMAPLIERTAGVLQALDEEVRLS